MKATPVRWTQIGHLVRAPDRMVTGYILAVTLHRSHHPVSSTIPAVV